MDAWAAYDAMCCDQLFFYAQVVADLLFFGLPCISQRETHGCRSCFWVGRWFFTPLWWHNSWGTLSYIFHTLQINITLFTVFTCIAYIYYIITILVAKLLQFVFTHLQFFFLVYDCDCVSMRICLDNNKLICIQMTGITGYRQVGIYHAIS